MVHDFAVDDTITKIFNFHFGVGVGHDLLDPVEDRGLGGHRTGSTGFLDHKKSQINNNLSNEIQLSLQLMNDDYSN